MENIKKINNSQYEIDIKLTSKEIAPYLEKAIMQDIKKVNEPGFRAGKMPKNMFLKKYGMEAIYPTAVDLIINEVYPKLITEKNLNVIAQPEFDWTTMKISENEGFEVKGKVDVMPEFEMPNLENVKKTIKKEVVKVTKKEIKDEIDNLLAHDAKYEVKDDYAANDGDITVIDFEGFVDNVAFEGGKGENHPLTLGSGSFIPGFEEQLIGSKAGDKKDVKVTFPEDYQADLAGKEATFKCSVKEVKKRTLPRLTAKYIENIKEFEVKTKEELENAIENKIKATKEQTINLKNEKELIQAYVKEANIIIPNSMIEHETKHNIENLEQNFKAQGISIDMYLQMTGMSMELLKEQMNEESKDKIARQLLVDKYLSTNEIKITKKEIDERMKKIVEDYKMKEEDILKQLGNTTDPIKRDLEFEKAMDILFK